jgi:cytoskeletal protein CcmA (bactofilin family)
MADKNEVNTVIGPDATIKGEMTFSQGKARILGTVEGRIDSAGEVVIESGSNCRASVEAAIIVVDGGVEGDLTARERLQLSGRAAVKGDIAAGSLVVAEGATFVGHCSVGPEASKRREMPAVEIKRPIAGAKARNSDWLNEPAAATNGTPKPSWIGTDDKN